MKESVEQLVNIIKLAHKRGAFSLEESAIIYQVLLGVNKCPVLQPPPNTPKNDLEIIDEDTEMTNPSER